MERINIQEEYRKLLEEVKYSTKLDAYTRIVLEFNILKKLEKYI